jgi:hypothetical protein
MYISMRTQREGQTQTFVWGRQEGAPSLRFSQAWRGASGFYIRQIWNVEGWDTDLRIELIQSAARISLRVRNSGDSPATLALRLASDVEVGVEEGFDRNGASRPPYVYVQGQRPIRVDSDLRGVQIPNAIEFYLSRGNLGGSSRYLLRPVKGFEDQTPIDRLVIGKWFFIQGTTIWEPVLFPDSFIGDVALNLFVNARNFAPGQVREYVFYVTLTPVDMDVQPPIALGIEALPVVEPDAQNLSQLRDNGQFTIVANVTNQYFVVGREIDLTDVAVDLSLPAGISLAPGESRTRTIPRLAPGQTAPFEVACGRGSNDSGLCDLPSLGAGASCAHKNCVPNHPHLSNREPQTGIGVPNRLNSIYYDKLAGGGAESARRLPSEALEPRARAV